LRWESQVYENFALLCTVSFSLLFLSFKKLHSISGSDGVRKKEEVEEGAERAGIGL
jgi:hypothetical protein